MHPPVSLRHIVQWVDSMVRVQVYLTCFIALAVSTKLMREGYSLERQRYVKTPPG